MRALSFPLPLHFSSTFAAPFHENPLSLEESKISELFVQAFGRCILSLGAPFVLFGQ